MKASNLFQIVGNLASDVQLKGVSGSESVGVFSVGVNDYYKNDKGEKVERVNWFNCVVFGKYAQVIPSIIKKGDTVLVTGSLRSRSYDHQQKGKVYVVELVVSSVLSIKSK